MRATNTGGVEFVQLPEGVIECVAARPVLLGKAHPRAGPGRVPVGEGFTASLAADGGQAVGAEDGDGFGAFGDVVAGGVPAQHLIELTEGWSSS